MSEVEQHIDIDVSGIVDPFARADAGEVKFQCTESELVLSKKDEQMVAAVFEITECENDDDLGKQLRDWMMMEGKGEKGGKWRWHQYVTVAGGDHADPSSIVGGVFEGYISVEPGSEEYPDESNRIKRVHGDF